MNQQTLCYYVAYLAKCNLSPAMIKVYFSAIRHHHIASDVPEPDRAKMQKLKIVSNGITRVSAYKTKETHTRLPITPDILHILRRIYRLWQPNRHEYKTILMWAASTLCFFGFLQKMGRWRSIAYLSYTKGPFLPNLNKDQGTSMSKHGIVSYHHQQEN